MNNQDMNNQSIIIEDLATQNAEEVKGGPRGSSAVVSLGKLGRVENQAQTENDDDTLRGVTLNHNETVTEDSEAEAYSSNETLIDLLVTDQQAEEAKGGWGNGKTYIDLNGNGLLPAVQKVR